LSARLRSDGIRIEKTGASTSSVNLVITDRAIAAETGVAVTIATATGSSLTTRNLSYRYLQRPAIDQILADEAVSDLATEGDLLWPLAENMGSVPDLPIGQGLTDYDGSGRHDTRSDPHQLRP
jgi:hypothetical protein